MLNEILNAVAVPPWVWPAAVILEVARTVRYLAGLAIAVRGTKPGDRPAVLTAYARIRRSVSAG